MGKSSFQTKSHTKKVAAQARALSTFKVETSAQSESHGAVAAPILKDAGNSAGKPAIKTMPIDTTAIGYKTLRIVADPVSKPKTSSFLPTKSTKKPVVPSEVPMAVNKSKIGTKATGDTSPQPKTKVIPAPVPTHNAWKNVPGLKEVKSSENVVAEPLAKTVKPSAKAIVEPAIPGAATTKAQESSKPDQHKNSQKIVTTVEASKLQNDPVSTEQKPKKKKGGKARKAQAAEKAVAGIFSGSHGTKTIIDIYTEAAVVPTPPESSLATSEVNADQQQASLVDAFPQDIGINKQEMAEQQELEDTVANDVAAVASEQSGDSGPTAVAYIPSTPVGGAVQENGVDFQAVQGVIASQSVAVEPDQDVTTSNGQQGTSEFPQKKSKHKKTGGQRKKHKQIEARIDQAIASAKNVGLKAAAITDLTEDHKVLQKFVHGIAGHRIRQEGSEKKLREKMKALIDKGLGLAVLGAEPTAKLADPSDSLLFGVDRALVGTATVESMSYRHVCKQVALAERAAGFLRALDIAGTAVKQRIAKQKEETAESEDSDSDAASLGRIKPNKTSHNRKEAIRTSKARHSAPTSNSTVGSADSTTQSSSPGSSSDEQAHDVTVAQSIRPFSLSPDSAGKFDFAMPLGGVAADVTVDSSPKMNFSVTFGQGALHLQEKVDTSPASTSATIFDSLGPTLSKSPKDEAPVAELKSPTSPVHSPVLSAIDGADIQETGSVAATTDEMVLGLQTEVEGALAEQTESTTSGSTENLNKMMGTIEELLTQPPDLGEHLFEQPVMDDPTPAAELKSPASPVFSPVQSAVDTANIEVATQDISSLPLEEVDCLTETPTSNEFIEDAPLASDSIEMFAQEPETIVDKVTATEHPDTFPLDIAKQTKLAGNPTTSLPTTCVSCGNRDALKRESTFAKFRRANALSSDSEGDSGIHMPIMSTTLRESVNDRNDLPNFEGAPEWTVVTGQYSAFARAQTGIPGYGPTTEPAMDVERDALPTNERVQEWAVATAQYAALPRSQTGLAADSPADEPAVGVKRHNTTQIGITTLREFFTSLPNISATKLSKADLVEAFLSSSSMEREELDLGDMHTHDAATVLANKRLPHHIFLGNIKLAEFLKTIDFDVNGQASPGAVAEAWEECAKKDAEAEALEVLLTGG